jgi:hypothetical protein
MMSPVSTGRDGVSSQPRPGRRADQATTAKRVKNVMWTRATTRRPDRPGSTTRGSGGLAGRCWFGPDLRDGWPDASICRSARDGPGRRVLSATVARRRGPTGGQGGSCLGQAEPADLAGVVVDVPVGRRRDEGEVLLGAPPASPYVLVAGWCIHKTIIDQLGAAGQGRRSRLWQAWRASPGTDLRPWLAVSREEQAGGRYTRPRSSGGSHANGVGDSGGRLVAVDAGLAAAHRWAADMSTQAMSLAFMTICCAPLASGRYVTLRRVTVRQPGSTGPAPGRRPQPDGAGDGPVG